MPLRKKQKKSGYRRTELQLWHRQFPPLLRWLCFTVGEGIVNGFNNFFVSLANRINATETGFLNQCDKNISCNFIR
nr:MAG TPA: hypothetical protein [Caudoviricetes sp.]